MGNAFIQVYAKLGLGSKAGLISEESWHDKKANICQHNFRTETYSSGYE
jgi:hypothetical protein